MASELTPEDVGKMKVADLRAELKARDLSTSGLKKELADRLLEHLAGGDAPAQETESTETPADPENGTDEPAHVVPSGDSTHQTAGEGPSPKATAEQAHTLDLPSEKPAVPPVTEDSIQDYEGAEGTPIEESALAGIETSNEPSEVVRPPADHLDKTPGFVADSRVEAANEKADVVPLNEAIPPPEFDEFTLKRKHDDLEDGPAVTDAGPAIESIAAQEESTAVPNDEIKPDPAADAILHHADGPETKRARTDDDASVPQEPAADITVEEINGDKAAPVNGASSSFPTSITVPDFDTPAGGSKLNDASAPDVVKLNQPQTQTDFAGAPDASALEAETAETNKSVPTVLSVRSVLSSSSPRSSSYLSHLSPKTVTNAISPCSFPFSPFVQSTDSLSEATARRSAKEDKERPPRSLLNIKGSSSSSTKPKQTETKNINETREKEYVQETTEQKPVASSSSSSATMQQQNASGSSQQQRQQTQNSDSPLPSRSICVSNLVRPFTLPSLKEKLEDFGETEFFWINTIKSHCFVSYASQNSAEEAAQSLQGEIWPEAVGKPLSVTYIPTEKIANLVEKETAAGRARFELVVTFDQNSNEWQYDVEPFNTTSKVLGQAPPVPRGLASSVPFQARVGPGRLDPRNTVTATTASGTAIQLPSNSAFAQRRQPLGRDPPHPTTATTSTHDRPWTPKPGAEDLYHKTRATPQLYYRPVDKVAAGRKLRELERGPYRPSQPSYRDNFRDRYRP